MNKKNLSAYRTVAEQTGLYLDEANGTIYGRRGEYEVLIYPVTADRPYQLGINICAERPDGQLTKEEIGEFCQALKQEKILTLQQKGNLIQLSLKVITNPQTLAAAVSENLNRLVALLSSKGYVNVCQGCGTPQETRGYIMNGSRVFLCPDCYSSKYRAIMEAGQEKAARKSNVIGGIAGAFLGSLIGAACIILISQLGFVAAISGIVMAAATVKGYELLGGKMNVTGVVICSLIMIAMVYVADRLDWAIVAYRAMDAEYDLFTMFRLVPKMLEAEAIEMSSYLGNLAMVYFFALIGAVPMITAAFQKEDVSSQFGPIGQQTYNAM